MAHFDKMRCHTLQACRARLIQSALESSAPGALNDGPDAKIRQLDTDLVTFEKIKFANDWKYFKFLQSLERIDLFKSEEIGPN